MRRLALLPACLCLAAQAPAQHQLCEVRGRITDSAGHPLFGAVVALVQPNSAGVPQHLAISDAKGAFRLDAPEGTYALTATHRDGLNLYAPNVSLSGGPLMLGSMVMKADGFRVEGKMEVPKPLADRDLDLAFMRVSQDDGDVFVTRVHQGAFSLRLGPGTYWLAIRDAVLGLPKSITVDADVPSLVVKVEATPTPAPGEVVAWIRAHAMPLKTVEAGHGFEDLRPLSALVSGARVVALGEATHGSREIFQLKHRLLEYLVSEQGFTAFAIEANLPECQALNDYVLHGTGEARKALDGIYFWTWNTEEVLALVEWMRAWNADPGHTRKVRFYGFDCQVARVAYQQVKARLEQEDPALAAWMAETLGDLSHPEMGRVDPVRARRLREAAAELGRRLDAKRGFDPFLRRCARVIGQKLDIDLDPQGVLVRDVGMAENVRWILEQEGPKGRVVLWAHDGHVQTGEVGGHLWMGGYLRKALGKELVVLGSAIRRGSFQAFDMGPNHGGLREFTVDPPATATFDAAADSTGLPVFALDLHAVPSRGVVGGWFENLQGTFNTGAGFMEGRDGGSIANFHLTRVYDGILFISRVTAARPNHPRN